MDLIIAILSLVVACVLFKTNKKIRYYTKFILYCFALFFAVTICIPIMLLRPRDYRNSFLPSWATRQYSKLLDLKWQVRGTENMLKNSGCVTLMNHQSSLDMIAFANIVPIINKYAMISKREVFFTGTFGLATWLWGTIFIDRAQSGKAQKTMNETIERIRNDNLKLVMFPEGTRHGGEDLLPFKKGAFHVAIASQTPIQPIIVSRYYFLDSKTYKFDGGTNIIEILPPIPTVGLTKDDLDKLMEKTYTIMNGAYKKVSQEVLSKFYSSQKIE